MEGKKIPVFIFFSTLEVCLDVPGKILRLGLENLKLETKLETKTNLYLISSGTPRI